MTGIVRVHRLYGSHRLIGHVTILPGAVGIEDVYLAVFINGYEFIKAVTVQIGSDNMLQTPGSPVLPIAGGLCLGGGGISAQKQEQE